MERAVRPCCTARAMVRSLQWRVCVHCDCDPSQSLHGLACASCDTYECAKCAGDTAEVRCKLHRARTCDVLLRG